MNKKNTGFSRPGAMQMLIALCFIVAAPIVPVYLAATHPSHEWYMFMSGVPAVAVWIAGLSITVLYLIGFLRYCSSKGYSVLLGILLLLGNIFGFLVLLLLPDIKAAATGAPTAKTRETSGSKA